MEIGDEPNDPNEYENAPAPVRETPEREWLPKLDPAPRDPLWVPEREPVKV